MEKNEKALQEQQAPLKNTDKAFVQVGKDGEPVIPQNAENKNHNDKSEERINPNENRR